MDGFGAVGVEARVHAVFLLEARDALPFHELDATTGAPGLLSNASCSVVVSAEGLAKGASVAEEAGCAHSSVVVLAKGVCEDGTMADDALHFESSGVLNMEIKM